ncbi:MAG TPA: DUF4339 domain-containing protein [Negativicutes bacterium]|nr:DUF4339 domain-containing protein [Negativicutes bacterium]
MYKINCEELGGVKKYIWHYRKGKDDFGPFTEEDILELIHEGEIGPDDLVLKFGNRKFMKASEVKGLLEAFTEPEDKMPETAEVTEVIPVAADGEVLEKREELNVAFENSITHLQDTHQKIAISQKLAFTIAALLGLALAIWLLIRIV